MSHYLTLLKSFLRIQIIDLRLYLGFTIKYMSSFPLFLRNAQLLLLSNFFLSQAANASTDWVTEEVSHPSQHPSLTPYLGTSENWDSLSAETFTNFDEEDEGLIFIFSPPTEYRIQQQQQISEIFSLESSQQIFYQANHTLATAAWKRHLILRSVFSNGLDLTKQEPGILCGHAPMLLLNKDADVTGFLLPGYLHFSEEEFTDFLGLYLQRHIDSPIVSGYNSKLATQLRWKALLEGNGASRQLASIANFSGSLVASSLAFDLTAPGNRTMQIIRLLQSKKSQGPMQTRLLDAATKIMDRTWEQIADSSLGVWESSLTNHETDTHPSYVSYLEQNTQIIIAELALRALLPERQLEDSTAIHQLLAQLKALFQNEDGQLSEIISIHQQDNEEIINCNWVFLDTAAQFAQANLLLNQSMEDLDWLEALTQNLDQPDLEALPANIFPQLAGSTEPVSLRGIAILGSTLELAAKIDTTNQEQWQRRSQELFSRFNTQCEQESGNYNSLPAEHPLAIPDELHFTDLQEPSFASAMGEWLYSLEQSQLAQAAEKRAHLATSFTQWSNLQSASRQDALLLQGIALVEQTTPLLFLPLTKTSNSDTAEQPPSTGQPPSTEEQATSDL